MEEEKIETLTTPGVVDRYQTAGKIANQVLLKVIKRCGVGTKIVEICQYGDKQIQFQIGKVYNKKRVEKGIGFPVCISVNNVCGHFSPSPEDSYPLKEGDVAKISLGVQIDGYIAQVAHTIVVKSDPNQKIVGKKADVILSCYKALQGAIRLMRPGVTNSQVTKFFSQIAKDYQVNPLQGVLSHELKKHLIDGNNVIINKETYEQKVEQHQFQMNQAYSLDVYFSTGDGRPKESDMRTTVYKRALDRNYSLKTKHARAFFTQLMNRFPSMGFTTRAFEDQITTKLGIKQCMQHQLLHPFPVLIEKEGEIVAHFSCTVLILQGTTSVITGINLDQKIFETDKAVSNQINLKLINYPMEKASQKLLRKQGLK